MLNCCLRSIASIASTAYTQHGIHRDTARALGKTRTMGLNAETPPPPPKSRGNSLKQFFQRPPSSSGTFRYPSPAASMASPSPKQAVYHPMAHYQQSSGRTPHSYTPPMTRAASMPSPPHMQHQGPGIPLSSATTASPVAPARQPMHGGYYGSTPSLSSVSSFDYYPSPTQYQHAPMYSTPQRQQPQPPVLYEQQQHGQWMNSAYSLPMDSSHQHQQRQQRQYYHQQQLPPQQILAASSLSLYNSTTAQYTAGLHNNVAAPMPQPPQSQTKEAVLKLEISSRNLLVEEAARDVLISPLKEVLQIVHCNEANVSPVMFSPGLSHYKPLYVWEMDPSVPPYNYKEHSEMALKVDKDLPPLQLLSPIRGTATSNGLTSKVSLAELYVSLSDIQLGMLSRLYYALENKLIHQ